MDTSWKGISTRRQLAWHFANFGCGVHWIIITGLRLGYYRGLLLPALVTSVMTYASTIVEKSVRPHARGLYIAATVIGGFSGLMMAGWVSEHFDLAAPSLVLALLYLLALPALQCLPYDNGAGFFRIHWTIAHELLSMPRFRSAYSTLATSLV